ncbi:MAG TPA: hypothetical protein VGC41_11800 [Kofleriaceae bacterium]
MPSDSADAITAKSLAGGGFGYGHTLAVEMPFGLALWADANASFYETTGQMFQSLATDLDAQLLTVGLHVTYHLWRPFSVSAGVGFGAEHADLQLTDSMSHVASDGAWGAVGRASVRLDMIGHLRGSLAMGFRGEFGYLATQAVGLTPVRSRDGDGDTLYLPMQESSIGRLDLGGPYFAFTFVTQF